MTVKTVEEDIPAKKRVSQFRKILFNEESMSALLILDIEVVGMFETSSSCLMIDTIASMVVHVLPLRVGATNFLFDLPIEMLLALKASRNAIDMTVKELLTLKC